MSMVIQLPDRLPALRRMAMTEKVDLHDAMCFAILTVNSEFVIDKFNANTISHATRRTAAKFCELYHWESFPLRNAVSCRDITVSGITLVLHDAQTL